jgi:hypothetical protein
MVSQQTDSSNSQQTESSSLRGKGKGSRPADPLAKVIEALVRDGKFISEYEWPLRLFQFMYWLIDDVETKVSLKEAALVFCSMAISQESDKVKKRFLSASGAELLLLTISRTGLRWIINEAFAGNSRLYDLALIPLIPYDKNVVDKIRREINILNALTGFRLRLNETVGVEPSLNNSMDLLSKSKSEEKCSATTSKKIERRRRERSAFLYIAEEVGSGALDLSYIYNESFESVLRVESGGDKESGLREYFAKVKGLLPILNKPLADKLDDAWSNLEPISRPRSE